MNNSAGEESSGELSIHRRTSTVTWRREISRTARLVKSSLVALPNRLGVGVRAWGVVCCVPSCGSASRGRANHDGSPATERWHLEKQWHAGWHEPSQCRLLYERSDIVFGSQPPAMIIEPATPPIPLQSHHIPIEERQHHPALPHVIGRKGGPPTNTCVSDRKVRPARPKRKLAPTPIMSAVMARNGVGFRFRRRTS